MGVRWPLLALAAATACVTLSAEAAAGTPQLRLGSHGPAVRALQQQLVSLGYFPGRTPKGVFDERTWHAVVAFQGWERIPRTGVVDRRTRARLATASRPRHWSAHSRALELDIGRQVLLVVSRHTTVRAIHVSSAAPGYYTPRGHFRVYRREPMSWSAPYSAWMPYALYFSGGFAVHGFGDVPAYPASHGCVRMPMFEAPWVYAMAPVGTPVVVR